jgi:hypothetical protein
MSSKKYQDLIEAYYSVYEQKVGVPLREPTDRAAKEQLEKMIPKGEKVILTKSSLQKAHYEPQGDLVDEQETGRGPRLIDAYDKPPYSDDVKYAPKYKPVRKLPAMKGVIRAAEEVDIYDQVLEYLVSEGCTLKESNYIMSYIVEQGVPPQEVIGRGIAHLLGFDKPHPTEVFARGLKKMLYPSKPVEVKAPKPPVTKPATTVTKPATTVTKPNPYRPGATIRATGPNMNKFPELQRFADQGRKVSEPVAKTVGALTALRNITPAGVAAAVMAPRPTADGTLTAARKRGDVAPPTPKLPAPEKPKSGETIKATAKPAIKPTVKSVPKPVANPETPKFGPIPPLPPLEKKPSIVDTLKDIRGSIEKSKERQKGMLNK